MTQDELAQSIAILERNLNESATPNIRRALGNQAPIAALVYALALVDAMAGFLYGVEARKQANGGHGVELRYAEFVRRYLSPGKSGCDYSRLDLYKSLRCNMAHSLTPGHLHKGSFQFVLIQGHPKAHGTFQDPKTVSFDVPSFCDDVLDASGRYLGEVHSAIGSSPLDPIIDNFARWWDEGYSTLVTM